MDGLDISTWPDRMVMVLEGTDPTHNLGSEEALWEVFPAREGQCWLILYVNSSCIVMGKNQNPLVETRFDEVIRQRLPLFRRCSGGGTVWHDEGNLNFSFFIPKADYQREKVFDFVVSTLDDLGFPLRVSDMGDLLLNGRKVSGSAYAHKRNKVLHHGTLLCNSRLTSLRNLLGDSGYTSNSIGVSSRPSPVTNLADHTSKPADAILPLVIQALVLRFNSLFGLRSVPPGQTDFQLSSAELFVPGSRLESLRRGIKERLNDPSWTFDRTPPFVGRVIDKGKLCKVKVEGGVVMSTEEAQSDEGPFYPSDGGLSAILGTFFFLNDVPRRRVEENS